MHQHNNGRSAKDTLPIKIQTQEPVYAQIDCTWAMAGLNMTRSQVKPLTNLQKEEPVYAQIDCAWAIAGLNMTRSQVKPLTNLVHSQSEPKKNEPKVCLYCRED
jgi:hypothetical protein